MSYRYCLSICMSVPEIIHIVCVCVCGGGGGVYLWDKIQDFSLFICCSVLNWQHCSLYCMLFLLELFLTNNIIWLFSRNLFVFFMNMGHSWDKESRKFIFPSLRSRKLLEPHFISELFKKLSKIYLKLGNQYCYHGATNLFDAESATR